MNHDRFVMPPGKKKEFQAAKKVLKGE